MRKTDQGLSSIRFPRGVDIVRVPAVDLIPVVGDKGAVVLVICLYACGKLLKRVAINTNHVVGRLLRVETAGNDDPWDEDRYDVILVRNGHHALGRGSVRDL